MRRDKEIRQIALQVSIALSAGMFSIMPHVSAAPVLDHVVSGGAVVDQTTTPQVTDITSTTRNNVIDWKDFSVAQGETVRFDGGAKTNNYLNVVSGANTSQIDGAIKGGDNVYIVNPNGVVFGNSASVDVGSLYVSSRPLDEVNYNKVDANGDMQPLADTASMSGGDIVNMGTVQANSVFVEGGNIILADVDRIKTADGSAVNNNVTIQTQGEITLGRSVSAMVAEEKANLLKASKVRSASGATNNNNSLGGNYRYTVNSTTRSVGSISNETDLAGVKNNLAGSYYMVDDVTVTATEWTPIGTDANNAFTGKFDGQYHTISGITVTSGTYGGLFGYVQGTSSEKAEIKNVGVVGGSVNASKAGGIAGYAEYTTFKNVFNEGTRIGDDSSFLTYGGIVGEALNSTIDTAYNTATVGATDTSTWQDVFDAGGIVGKANGTTIMHVYNTGTVANGIAGSSATNGGNILKDAYYTNGDRLQSSDFAATEKENVIEDRVDSSNKNLTDYTGKLSSITNVGSNATADEIVWRIYEGQDLPFLRAFLLKDGNAVTVNYSYTHGEQSGSNGGADLTADSLTDDGSKLTYNGSYMVVDGIPAYSDDNIVKSKIKYANDGERGVKNVTTKALFYTGQQGYELIGNNVTMAKRQITVEGADIDLSKVYDGKADVTAAFKKAFSEGAGTGTAGGILSVDKDYVKIDYDNDVTATFADTATERGKDVGKDKVVNLTGNIELKTKNDTAAAKEILANYDIADADKSLSGKTVTGTITPRTLLLTIDPTSGIDKIYDGNAEVAEEYAAANVIKLDTTNTVTVENAQNSTAGLISGDKVRLKGNDAKAYYVDADETHNSNAGAHKILYTGVALDTEGDYADGKNYVLKYQTGTGSSAAEVEVSGGKVLLDGTINRRLILSDDFKVKVGGVIKDATKPYDGNDSYTLPEGAVLVAPTGSSGDTGVIEDDEDYLHFALKNSGSYFKDDNGGRTANASDNTKAESKASKVAYAIDATADAVTRDGKTVNLLANYQIGTQEEYKEGKAKNLDTATDLTVGGDGTITRLAVNITADNVTGIEKVYDGNNKLKEADTHYAEYTTMGNKVKYATNSPTLVGNDKFIIGVEYDDKNVKRNADGAVVYNEKDVYFKAYIDGDAAGNYTLNGTNAETYNSANQLTLSGAKGTITPKIITPEFNTITKTYDGSEAINTGDATASTYDWKNQLVEGDEVNLIYSTEKEKAYFTKADGTTKAKDVAMAAKVRYTGLALDNGNYELSATELTGAGNINRRLILSDSFTVNGDEAVKTYDGKSTYTLAEGATLTSAAGASGNTGVVTDDVPHLHFSLKADGDTYFTEENGTTKAQDVAKAKKVAYAVNATTDTDYEQLLGNYKLGDTTSATNLDEKNTDLHVSGKGHIDRRALTITADGVKDINKTYDTNDTVKNENGSDYFTMGKAVKYAEDSAELVSDDGTSWNINATYNGSDVYRDPDTDKVVANGKDVTFKVNIAGDAAANYTLNGKNAELYNNTSQLELTGAKGTINPATITPVFNKITKTYTGTTLITDGGATQSTVNLDGNLDGDAVTLNYVTDKDHAYFAEANAGDYIGKVTYKGFSLEGAKSGNYQLLSDTATGDGKINKATIGMSDLKLTVENVSREYNGGTAVGENAADFVKDAYIDFGDGKNNVKFTYTAIDSAVYSSEGTGSSVAGAGTGKKVTYTISGIKVPDSVLANFDWKTGDGYKNTKTYEFAEVGTITPKKVYATVNGSVTKDYDATPAVKSGESVLTGESLVHIEGLLADDGSKNETEAVYIESSVGAGDAADHGEKNKSVKYIVKLDDASTGNYIIYDDANYTTKVSDSDKFTTHNNTINQRDLTLKFNPVSKEYDGYTNYGNSTVEGDKAYTFTIKKGNDDITIDDITIADGYTANANYDSPNATTAATVVGATTVTYDKLTVNGNEKGNYRLLDAAGNALSADENGQYTTTGKGTIEKCTLDSAPKIEFEHVNKEYDGTNAVVFSRTAAEDDPKKFINATIDNGTKSLGFDLVDAHYTGSYVNSDDGKTIRSGGTQNAATFTIKFSSDNYNFSTTITDPNFVHLSDGSYQYSASYDNATITPRTITVALGDKLSDTQNHYVTKTYDGDTGVHQPVTQDLFKLGDDDVLTKTDGTKDKVSLVIDAQYQGKNAGDQKNVDYALSLDGDDANNYRLNTAKLTGQGDIQKAELVVNDNTFAPVEKVYDGNKNVTTLTSDKVHFVGVQKADGTNETINVGNAIWDGTGDNTYKIIGKYDSENVQWQEGTDEEASQGVTYSNLQKALDSMTDGDGEKISTNYTIADTAYFAAAKGKGKIKAISITNDAVAHWTPVTREYNAYENVDGAVYSYENQIKGDKLLSTQEILQLAVTDKDGKEIAVDYEATANFNGKNVGDNKTLNYEITQVNRKVADKDGNRNYKLSDDTYNKLLGKTLTSNADNQISKRQINAVVQKTTNITKVYDGTTNASTDNFVLDEEDRKVLADDGYKVDEVIEKSASYRDKDATILPGAANANSLIIDYTLKMTTADNNYEVITPTATATGDIERRTLSITTDPVSVNAGEAMPVFTGDVIGFAKDERDKYLDFIKGIRYKAADGVTTNNPGSYGVYGWYMSDKSGLLDKNYIYVQAPSNATALTVNYVNNNTGNPDTKITPNNNIYNQISKDMNSGFGDNGAAAIEYKDKSGKVLGTENIDSGEINGKGLTIGGTDMSKQADSNAHIGIAGGDIVNMEGANAAGSVNVETSSEGTVVNLEVFSIGEDTQSGDKVSVAEITNTTDKTYSLELDNSTEGEIAIKNTNDTTGAGGSIAITNEKQNILSEEVEDKKEDKEKEGEIAIKSSNGEDDDEIELTVEKEGVNVA